MFSFIAILYFKTYIVLSAYKYELTPNLVQDYFNDLAITLNKFKAYTFYSNSLRIYSFNYPFYFYIY
jgi:hypothetical protein